MRGAIEQVAFDCRAQRYSTLKRIAEELRASGSYTEALYYAGLGLIARPTIKWLGLVFWLALLHVRYRAVRFVFA